MEELLASNERQIVVTGCGRKHGSSSRPGDEIKWSAKR